LDADFLLGGNLNAASRQALMQKLARIEPASKLEPMSVSLLAESYLILINITYRARPNIQAMESRCVLLKNMFSPEEYAILDL
jgi:RNA-binding protein 39